MKSNIFKIDDGKYAINTGDIKVIEFSGDVDILKEILYKDSKLSSLERDRSIWKNTISRIHVLENIRKTGNKIVILAILGYIGVTFMFTPFNIIVSNLIHLIFTCIMGIITGKTTIFLVCGSKKKNDENLAYAEDRYNKFDKEIMNLEGELNGLRLKNDYEVVADEINDDINNYEYVFDADMVKNTDSDIEFIPKIKRLSDKNK